MENNDSNEKLEQLERSKNIWSWGAIATSAVFLFTFLILGPHTILESALGEDSSVLWLACGNVVLAGALIFVAFKKNEKLKSEKAKHLEVLPG